MSIIIFRVIIKQRILYSFTVELGITQKFSWMNVVLNQLVGALCLYSVLFNLLVKVSRKLSLTASLRSPLSNFAVCLQ